MTWRKGKYFLATSLNLWRMRQPLLDAGSKHSAAGVVAKAQAVLSEPEQLRAMFDVRYFPPSKPPQA